MKKTIRAKIMITVLITILPAFLVSGVGAYRYFYNILEKNTVSGEGQKLSQTARQLTYIQDTIISIAKQIVIDDEVQTLARENKEVDTWENLLTEKKVKTTLRTYINQMPYIYGVTVVTSKQGIYSSNSTEENFLEGQDSWYHVFKKTGRYKGFSQPHTYLLEQGTQKREVISYIMSFKDIQNGKDILGEVILHVGIPDLKKLASLDAALLQGYALFDKDGDSILENGTLSLPYGELDKISTEASLANDNTVLVSHNLEDDWVLVSEISNDLLLQQLKFVGIFFLGITFVVVAALLSVLYVMISNITKPIEQLHQAAIQVGLGNMDVTVDIKTNDELAVLGEGFNSMVDDIKKRMEESIQYEKTTREMEINRLMLQINPHFIYNTLNSIVYMAKTQGNQDIVKFSNAFISLLQDTLQVQKDSVFISMKQELKNIQNYLILQSYRYPEQFTVQYQVDESVYPALVPNVLIQPIVENAIFHGLAGKWGKGTLEIGIERVGEKIHISIRDDGLGMTEDMVRQLLEEKEPVQGQMRTIGVGNVKSRIEHIYGSQYGMNIKSIPGKGTWVTLRIPFWLEERKGAKES